MLSSNTRKPFPEKEDLFAPTPNQMVYINEVLEFAKLVLTPKEEQCQILLCAKEQDAP